MARWFGYAELDPAADMRLAVDSDGLVHGYADVSGPEDGAPKAWIDLRALPGHPEALEALFAWAEQRAAERAGASGTTHFFVDERDDALRAILADRGTPSCARRSRWSARSRASRTPELAGRDPRRPFEEAHAEAVHQAHVEAFTDHWGYEPASYAAWRAHNLSAGQDTTLWRVAWDGDDIAGLCINRPSRGEDDAVGWVGVLAVRRPWRRRGLGEALLREAFAGFAARGKRSAGLGVDAENTTGAVALYERVGMLVGRRSDTWERTA